MDFNLIYKYLSGELDEQQTAKLLEWVRASETNKKFFARIRNSWTKAGLSGNIEDIDLAHEFELLTVKIDQEERPGKRVLKIRSTEKPGWRPLYLLLRIAAILLIIYSIGGTAFYIIRNKKTEYNLLSTKRGEKTSLVLSDGTKIWLNSETTLKYPTDITKRKVNIYLEGEAYFNVAKNQGRKLIVNASNIKITVLGTSFNVKSYANERTVETTLEKGTVLITPEVKKDLKSRVFILKPNQRATYIKKTNNIYISDLPSVKNEETEYAIKTGNDLKGIQDNKTELILSDLENTKLYTSWKDGQLVFKSEKFEDLACRMERWYNVHIEIKSQELKNSKYTGRFEKETVEQALKALSLSLPFKYSIDLNKVTIYKE
ncbi:MAG: FecR family protein [Bacteroidales bacterium]|nr:FecR family protein [Bacteroidales bacterium]